jgi:hypothetical protein
MGLLDEAIREHLELKRHHGANEDELARQEAEALGPVPEEEPARDELEELDEPSEREPRSGELGSGRGWPLDRPVDTELASGPDEPTFAWRTRLEDDVDEPLPAPAEKGPGGLASERGTLSDEPSEERAETPTEDFEPVPSASGSGAGEVGPPDAGADRPGEPEVGPDAARGERGAGDHEESAPPNDVAGPWEPLAATETSSDADPGEAEGFAERGREPLLEGEQHPPREGRPFLIGGLEERHGDVAEVEGDGVELKSDAAEAELGADAAPRLDAELPPEEELPPVGREPAPDALDDLEENALGETTLEPSAEPEGLGPEERVAFPEVAPSSRALEEDELGADPGEATQAWSVVDEDPSMTDESEPLGEPGLGAASAPLEEPLADEDLLLDEPAADEPREDEPREDEPPSAEAPIEEPRREPPLLNEPLPTEVRPAPGRISDAEPLGADPLDEPAEEPFEAPPDAYLESRPSHAGRHEAAAAGTAAEEGDDPRPGSDAPASRGFFEETEEHEAVWREGDPGADPDFEN